MYILLQSAQCTDFCKWEYWNTSILKVNHEHLKFLPNLQCQIFQRMTTDIIIQVNQVYLVTMGNILNIKIVIAIHCRSNLSNQSAHKYVNIVIKCYYFEYKIFSIFVIVVIVYALSHVIIL